MGKTNIQVKVAEESDFEKIQELNLLLFKSDFQYNKTLNLEWPKSEIGIEYFKKRINSQKT